MIKLIFLLLTSLSAYAATETLFKNVVIKGSLETSSLGVIGSTLNVKDTLSLENQKAFRFYEASGNGTNYFSLKAPAALGSDLSFTLPSADGANGDVLSTNGSGTLSFALPSASANLRPDVQIFSVSNGTYNRSHRFFISSGSATAGATYTNNSITYTVKATISSATQVWMTGNGDPTTSGTLTKATGTGDSTLTFSSFKKPLYLIVNLTGSGGGGMGSGTTTPGNGGTGSSCEFGTSLIAAGGGSGGGPFFGGAGGTTLTINSPAIEIEAVQGANGGAFTVPSAASDVPSGPGGSSCLGGGGASSIGGSAGYPAKANSGSGGGGASVANSTAAGLRGAGGGAGACITAMVPNPSGSYGYQIGAYGAGGTATTLGFVGGDGASCRIKVIEHYQ